MRESGLTCTLDTVLCKGACLMLHWQWDCMSSLSLMGWTESHVKDHSIASYTMHAWGEKDAGMYQCRL